MENEIQDQKQVILPLGNTLFICDSCQRVDASSYKIRRAGGKYILLCDDSKRSCAIRDVTPNCSFLDFEGASCVEMADFEIHPQEGPTRKIIYSCPLHAGILLINGKNDVYPTVKARPVFDAGPGQKEVIS